MINGTFLFVEVVLGQINLVLNQEKLQFCACSTRDHTFFNPFFTRDKLKEGNTFCNHSLASPIPHGIIGPFSIALKVWKEQIWKILLTDDARKHSEPLNLEKTLLLRS